MDICIYLLNKLKKLSSFLTHIIYIFLAYSSKFVSNKPFSNEIILRLVAIIFHTFVKGISGEETAGQRLHLDHDFNEETDLAFCKIFEIIIFFSANWASTLL